jgi:hypothetical protein
VPQNVGHWSSTDAASYSKFGSSRKSVFCVTQKLIFKYCSGLHEIQATKHLEMYRPMALSPIQRGTAATGAVGNRLYVEPEH